MTKYTTYNKEDVSIKRKKQTLHKILFVGINGIAASQNFANNKYLCVTLFSNQQAIEWLAEEAMSIQLGFALPIFAIVGDIDWLKADNFALLKAIKSQKNLKKTPIVAVAEKKATQIEQVAWLKQGIDDCYTLPIDWRKLYTRLIFLKEMKAISQKIDLKNDSIFSENGLKLPRSKRILDIVVAMSGLIIFSPLLLLIALFIKLESKGTVIYASKRAGTAYQIFDFYKFRTMYVDSDKQLSDLQHLNQYAFSDTKTPKTFVKIQNDPRITHVGKFLRMTSLDELPQLFNVLKGDMSLVGNRPLPLYEAQQLTCDHWAARFLAPAGITGLWQISKRGKKEMSANERIELDIEYAKNYSFWNDLKILLRTIPAMIQKEVV
ncbi:MAG: sugar transferase [Chitinophagales bacterium]